MSVVKRLANSPFLAPTWIWIAVNLFAGGAIGYYALAQLPRIAWPIVIGCIMAAVGVFDQRATIRAFEGGTRLWHEVPRRVRWLFMFRLFLLRAAIICAVGVIAAAIVGNTFGMYVPER